MPKILTESEVKDRINALLNIHSEVESHRDYHLEHGVKFDKSYTYIENIINKEIKKQQKILYVRKGRF